MTNYTRETFQERRDIEITKRLTTAMAIFAIVSFLAALLYTGGHLS